MLGDLCGLKPCGWLLQNSICRGFLAFKNPGFATVLGWLVCGQQGEAGPSPGAALVPAALLPGRAQPGWLGTTGSKGERHLMNSRHIKAHGLCSPWPRQHQSVLLPCGRAALPADLAHCGVRGGITLYSSCPSTVSCLSCSWLSQALCLLG